MTESTPPPETAANDDSPPQPTVAPDPVVAISQENLELKDRLLRTLAEMENLRRRTEREIADARSYAIASFAREVLSVGDNIRRALESTGSEWKAQADAAGQVLFDGVELTERELLKVLEKHGVKKLEPHGQKFDPNLHQAMFEIEDASVPTGTIVQVLQAGFTIGDRILRPALVGVAKGAAKSESVDAPANSGASGK
jgi:molecular chaperone GrpE